MARVLVVDDDLFFRTLVSEFVTHLGHEASTAVRAEDALVAMTQADFDLLIVDVHMEGMNGLELLSELTIAAQRRAITRTPVIVMTSDDKLATEQKARSAHASAFLLKPFSEDVLHEAVRQALRRNN